jgi:UDP-N-acetylmuramoyl-L-alanyl-D-glutamate--2,6-diaminopimelate ligase
MDIKSIVPRSIRNYYHSIQSTFANMKYDFPAAKLKVIGVTGTDGKTTTVNMIYEILKAGGYKVALISTVCAKIDNKEINLGFHVTTPDPHIIPYLLKKVVDGGNKWVVLEVTSHALDQNRVANIVFSKAVFTNITPEHLDYHGNWKSYALAKAKLINLVEEGGEIIYKEDEQGGRFIEHMVKRNPKVLLKLICNDNLVKKSEVNKEGIKFKYLINGREEEVYIPILGSYNIANAQCAIKTCEGLVKNEVIIEALSKFKGVQGRMQVIKRKVPCMIIIDFAHTINALKRALLTINSMKEKGKIFVVFGTAGLRDKTKRYKMGLIASKYADVIIITSEDPRIEKLKSINNQILEGSTKSSSKLLKRFVNRDDFRKINIEDQKRIIDVRFKEGKKSLYVFDEESPHSREDAIELAIKLATKEDIVLSTGKGHETSMCFGKKEYKWSEYKTVIRAINKRYKK